MLNETIKVIDSIIAEDAIIQDYTTLINSKIGKMSMLGKFSKIAFSELNDLSYTGEYTIIINTNIGKFTSISWGVTIGPEDHDYSRVTNHSFLYSVKTFKLTDKKYYSPFERPCEIGNDVWIGCNSTILRGVKIGDGVVIGANSLVNRDIPAYAIAVGSPAKIIKYRFDKATINRLLELSWWNYSLDTIKKNPELFSLKPTEEVLFKIKEMQNDKTGS